MNNFRVTAQVWFVTLLLVLTEQAAHNHNRKVILSNADLQTTDLTPQPPHSGERWRERI